MSLSASIDGKPVSFEKNETILQVARRYGVFIPTLCELHDLAHAPGVCRVCLVELRRSGDIPLSYVAACVTPLEADEEVLTRTPQVQEMRRTQVELILAEHNQDCAICLRHGDCELIDAAVAVGLGERKYTQPPHYPDVMRTEDAAIVYDPSRCIRCQRCIAVCRDVQGIAALELFGKGMGSAVGLLDGAGRADSPCVNCGQCVMVCPTGALAERDDTQEALRLLADPAIVTVFQVAPAVRVAFGAELGLPPESNVEGQVVTALRKMGADIVLDTNFAADLVIMEEGNEVLQKLLQRAGTTFTSCCPGWVDFVEKNFPELLPDLSTTRSPQQCLGALIKRYLAARLGYAPHQVRVISIMPCTAKKYEAARDEFRHDGAADVDLVLTLREFVRLLRRQGIDLRDLPPSAFDSPLSEYSGAGTIFGTSGGVMEAALRTLYHAVNGRELEQIEITAVRGFDNVRAASIDVGGAIGTLDVAVCHGLKAAGELAAAVRSGKVHYDFVEVMACPGGCIVGGGHLRSKKRYLRHAAERTQALYAIDRQARRRQSHRNTEVQQLYLNFLGAPLSDKAHELLHTHYQDRKRARLFDLQRVWEETGNAPPA